MLVRRSPLIPRLLIVMVLALLGCTENGSGLHPGRGIVDAGSDSDRMDSVASSLLDARSVANDVAPNFVKDSANDPTSSSDVDAGIGDSASVRDATSLDEQYLGDTGSVVDSLRDLYAGDLAPFADTRFEALPADVAADSPPDLSFDTRPIIMADALVDAIADLTAESVADGPAGAQLDSAEETGVDESLAVDLRPPPCGAEGQACCANDECQAVFVCTANSCVEAVAPSTACAVGASDAVFLTEQAPPSSMTPWQKVRTTVTFANCSGKTWTAADPVAPAGFKLGTRNPQDNDAWGSARIALPADVPSGSQVTIAIPLQATPLTGRWGYGLGILNEGVAWLTAFSPSHIITVEATSATATLCPGVQADIGGGVSASAQIQQCIDNTPSGGVLELPAGIYRITSEIAVNKPLTLRTSGTDGSQVGCLDPSAPRCVVFRADDNLNLPRGFFRPGTTDHVALDHIVLDGDRDARLSSEAAATCASGTNNGAGFNASTSGCVACSFLYSASVRALCGTGFEWLGAGATIDHSVFEFNGDHATTNMWSDGLTLLQSDNAIVTNSRFIDNSDIGLICGGGQNAVFRNNYIAQVHQASFAALMLDNFNGTTSGNFTGATVSGNTVMCPGLLCDFAIELGPHPWYLSANLIGGTVKQNTVVGGKFNINAEGAGTAESPMVVTGNVLGDSPSVADFFGCGAHAATAFNVSPDSHVDVGAGPAATGNITQHLCP